MTRGLPQPLAVPGTVGQMNALAQVFIYPANLHRAPTLSQELCGAGYVSRNHHLRTHWAPIPMRKAEDSGCAGGSGKVSQRGLWSHATDRKGWRSIQDFPLPPFPPAISLLGVSNFEFPSSVIRLAESLLLPDFCLQVPSNIAHKSRFLGKSFLDTDEERITWESVCRQLVCTPHFII